MKTSTVTHTAWTEADTPLGRPPQVADSAGAVHAQFEGRAGR